MTKAVTAWLNFKNARKSPLLNLKGISAFACEKSSTSCQEYCSTGSWMWERSDRSISPLVLAASFYKEEAVRADGVESIDGVDVVRGQRAVGGASPLPSQVETAAIVLKSRPGQVSCRYSQRG